MPATTKEKLLDVTAREFLKLETLLDDVRRSEALAKDDDDVSIKDVVAHRAHWVDLFFGWYEDGQAGREVFFPAKGYKWSELKRYNADLRARQGRVSWSKAREALRVAHHRLLLFISESSDKTLYSGPMKGAQNAWTPGRWAEAAGPSHYRSAGKYIRARLRVLRS